MMGKTPIKRTRRSTKVPGKAIAFRLSPALVEALNKWAADFPISRNKLVELALRHVVDGRSLSELHAALAALKPKSGEKK